MKNRKILASLLVCALLTGILFALSACGKPNQNGSQQIENPIEITISIKYPDKAKKPDIEAVGFKVEKKSTVMLALQLYCSVHEIPLMIDTTSNTVQGINNIENGVLIKNRMWKYRLNGRLNDAAAAEKKLHDGDELQWVYVEK
jgi:hypothetical protein